MFDAFSYLLEFPFSLVKLLIITNVNIYNIILVRKYYSRRMGKKMRDNKWVKKHINIVIVYLIVWWKIPLTLNLE
jgi:hypothetical protein